MMSCGASPATAAGNGSTTLAKGQVRAVPANDLPAQRAFIHRVFGLAA
jgi:hypothetical protein